MSALDFDDAWNRAREDAPFSNGTEGEWWTGQWCGGCLRDAPFRNGIAKTGCPLLLVAVLGRTPAEWMAQPDSEVYRADGMNPGNLYHCIEFRGPGGGGGEPRPKPEPPDMDGLFERPERRARMFVQPELVRQAVAANG